MRTFSFMIQKGGTAKTTSTAALAEGLHGSGKTVLLIDLDPQQNLSFVEGMDVLQIDRTLYDVWKGEVTIQDAIHCIKTGLDIITGGLALASADFEFSGKAGREQLLKRSLDGIRNEYDYCLVDCPPSLGLLTMAAATAADGVVIPMTCDALSLQGLSQLWSFLGDIRTYCNNNLTVSGILLTQYDERTITTKALEQQIIAAAEQAGTKVYDTRIHRSAAIRTAQAAQADIFGKPSRAADDYMQFTMEFLKDVKEG